MKKRIFLTILVICMLFAAVPMASATEVDETTAPVVREPGACGEDMTWSYEDGLLTITGSGAMDDFSEDAAPWQAHKDEITEVVISGDVTYIGANAFRNFNALETVDFGDALYEIGTEAFRSCDGLTSISLPATFKIFGDSCFLSCENLKEIHCDGVFPSFRQNCLWATYATIYYPAERPWGVEYIQQLEEAFQGRIQFIASDGTDHYVPEETDETEAEETEPEATEPETLPPTEPTVPPTEATVPVTEEAPAEAVTEAPAATEPLPTVPVTEPVMEEEPASSAWIGIVIVVLVLCLIVLGALIFGGSRKKGKYSRRGKGRR